MGGIIQDMQGILLEAGGMPDYVHLLVGLKPIHKPAEIVQNIKRGSSIWINELQCLDNKFSWQEGYGIFTVGYSSRNATQRYIQNQEQHHAQRSFDDEWLLILNRHGIAYDVKYAFG